MGHKMPPRFVLLLRILKYKNLLTEAQEQYYKDKVNIVFSLCHCSIHPGYISVVRSQKAVFSFWLSVALYWSVFFEVRIIIWVVKCHDDLHSLARSCGCQGRICQGGWWSLFHLVPHGTAPPCFRSKIQTSTIQIPETPLSLLSSIPHSLLVEINLFKIQSCMPKIISV